MTNMLMCFQLRSKLTSHKEIHQCLSDQGKKDGGEAGTGVCGESQEIPRVERLEPIYITQLEFRYWCKIDGNFITRLELAGLLDQFGTFPSSILLQDGCTIFWMNRNQIVANLSWDFKGTATLAVGRTLVVGSSKMFTPSLRLGQTLEPTLIQVSWDCFRQEKWDWDSWSWDQWDNNKSRSWKGTGFLQKKYAGVRDQKWSKSINESFSFHLWGDEHLLLWGVHLGIGFAPYGSVYTGLSVTVTCTGEWTKKSRGRWFAAASPPPLRPPVCWAGDHRAPTEKGSRSSGWSPLPGKQQG